MVTPSPDSGAGVLDYVKHCFNEGVHQETVRRNLIANGFTEHAAQYYTFTVYSGFDNRAGAASHYQYKIWTGLGMVIVGSAVTLSTLLMATATGGWFIIWYGLPVAGAGILYRGLQERKRHRSKTFI